MATESVLQTYESLVALNLWKNRAPFPDEILNSQEGPIFIPVGHSTTLEVYPTNGHTKEGSQDLIVYMKADEDEPPILFFVDVINPKWAPYFRFGTDDLLSYILLHEIIRPKAEIRGPFGTDDLLSYILLHEKLLEFDLGGGVFVGGHVNQLGSRDDILVSRELVNVVLDASAEALASVSIHPMATEIGFFDTTSTYYNNRWALFRNYMEVVNHRCAELVVAQFGCRLAGIDAVAESLCDVGQTFWGISA